MPQYRVTFNITQKFEAFIRAADELEASNWASDIIEDELSALDDIISDFALEELTDIRRISEIESEIENLEEVGDNVE